MNKEREWRTIPCMEQLCTRGPSPIKCWLDYGYCIFEVQHIDAIVIILSGFVGLTK